MSEQTVNVENTSTSFSMKMVWSRDTDEKAFFVNLVDEAKRLNALRAKVELELAQKRHEREAIFRTDPEQLIQVNAVIDQMVAVISNLNSAIHAVDHQWNSFLDAHRTPQ